MKRKFLCLLLALTLVLGLAATVSADSDRITSGDWTYEISEGKAILCSYLGSDTNVVVPAKIDGYAVSEVGPSFSCAFGNVADTMTSVTLSEGIERINTNAFKNCTALKKAIIPGSVRSISSSAFEGCTSLADVELNEGLKSIGRYAFLNTSLTSIVIPASVTTIDEDSIGYNGEWGNTEQVEILGIFGWSGTAAEEYARSWHFAFYRLEDMEEDSGRCGSNATWRFEESTGTLYIEGEDDTDPYYNSTQPWIAYCDQIKRVVVGEGINHLGDGFMADHYPNLTDVSLPSSLISIENFCFRGCTALTSIELPEKCSYLGGRAFENTGLRSVVLHSAKDFYGSYLGGNAFANCTDLETVFFAGDAWEFGGNVFLNDTLNAWYPVGNTTWTEDVLQQYGGNVTWLAYDPDLFLDVPVDSFYYDPVAWAVENGITNGISDTEFGSTSACNRAQVVTFLWRAAGCPEPTVTEHSFVDVEAGSFYEKAVLWAVENNITNGTDETHFSPNMSCNRATVVTFLWRAKGMPTPASSENPFADVPDGTWYTDPVLWAVENGITNGMTATEFGPNTVCNRAQVVTFLYRASSVPGQQPAQPHTFELRSNDPSEETGYVYCEGSTYTAGESVLFYAEPWYGYVVEFEAEPADADLELYYLGAGTYELIMPDHDVVLTANFVPAQGSAHTITTTCTNGFAFADCDMDDDFNDFAKPGEFVLFYIVPEEGYTLSEEGFTVTVNGERWENAWYLGELVEEDPDLGTIDGIFLCEMVMPDADVNVTITCTADASANAAEVRIPVTVQ